MFDTNRQQILSGLHFTLVSQLIQFPDDRRASIHEAIGTKIETSQLRDIRDSWQIFHEIML